MVTRLALGDAMVAAAEAALADGEGEKTTQFLKEAKAIYHEAQVNLAQGVGGGELGWGIGLLCWS